MIEETNTTEGEGVSTPDTSTVQTLPEQTQGRKKNLTRDELKRQLHDEVVDESTESADTGTSKSTDKANPENGNDSVKEKDGEKLEEPGEGENFKEQFQSLSEELKKEKERNGNIQKLLDRLGTEVGLLRKKTPQQILEIKQKAKELLLEEKDDEALEILRAIDKEEQDKVKTQIELEEKKAIQNAVEINKANIKELIPDFDSSLPEILEVMKEDGTNDEVIGKTRENPFSIPYQLTYNLKKRADLKKEVSSLQGKISELETQINSLKKRPNNILKNISEAANRNSLNGKAGAGDNSSSEVNIHPKRMTREQLKKALYDT